MASDDSPLDLDEMWAEVDSLSSEVMKQFQDLVERLEDQAEQADSRIAQILTRLDTQADLLRDLAGRPRPERKSTNLSRLLLTYESPNAEVDTTKVSDVSTEKSSDRPSPKLTVPSVSAAVTATRAAGKSRRASLHSRGTGLFTTFTEADLALRNRAAEMDSYISRQRFADGTEGVVSLEDQREPSRLQKAVKHPAFDSCFAMVVIVNCFFIAFEVQDTIWTEGSASIFLMITQYSFTILFTVELALRFCASGWRLMCGDEWSWILLDIVIVVSALTEMSLALVSSLVNEGGGSVQLNLSGFKAFRIIRVTRILKTLRLVRVFRFIMALRTLVTSILYTLKSLFWAMALLLLIVFVFAVLLVEAVSDYWGSLENPDMPPDVAWRVQAYFASLPHAMLSLFMSISGGVSWEEVLVPLSQISNLWVVVYLFYACVFCQSAIDSAQNDHANVVQSMLANKEAHVEKIKELFSRLGADKTGVITYGMFEEGIQTPAVIEYFETLGLDVWDAWSFFKLLDLDAGGSVEIEEFFKGCLRLRGQARGVDLGKLLHDQRWLIKAQGRFQTYVEAKLGEMCDVLDLLHGTPKLSVKAPSNFMRGISPVNQEERES